MAQETKIGICNCLLDSAQPEWPVSALAPGAGVPELNDNVDAVWILPKPCVPCGPTSRLVGLTRPKAISVVGPGTRIGVETGGGMSHSWVPRPIDTSDVAVPGALTALVEALAENSHDVWGRQRISEGWRYGKVRDDERRTNPLLVSYAELSDAEQEIDRQLAMEMVKLILKLGYLAAAPRSESADAPRPAAC